MNTTTTSLIAGIAMLAAACGSEGDPVTVADENSAVTAPDADAGIVEEGDDRPPEEADRASVVSVIVDLPIDVELAGTVIVALEDITYADAEGVEIGRVELPVAQLRNQGNRVELFLPLPFDGSVDVTATVHIDVDESGGLSPGDWISPELAMVGADPTTPVTVSIVPI